MKLSKIEARNLMLFAQGLSNTYIKPATKDAVLETITKMGMLQIDTINIVARSHYLVLWSRLGNYKTEWLDELSREKKIFEYWSHAMCFLPISDYPLYRRLAIDKKGHWGERAEKWFGENKGNIEVVLNHIRKNGETRSSDFKRSDGQKGAWWNWKVEKIALEVLFDRGDLMITRRHNFHRHYDLRERVLPKWEDKNAPTYKNVIEKMTVHAIKALGVAKADWISDYFYTPKRDLPNVLKHLIAKREIFKVNIDSLGEAYIHKSFVNFKPPDPRHTTLLSPFDPLVNNRKRAFELFDFDYKIECYTPAQKRKYGYFTLPILHNGQLIGRLDPKAHRKEGVFEVKSIYLEPKVKVTDKLVSDVAKAIQDCAVWHNCPEVKITKSNRKEFKSY